jgi:uncharacterized protein Veg
MALISAHILSHWVLAASISSVFVVGLGMVIHSSSNPFPHVFLLYIHADGDFLSRHPAFTEAAHNYSDILTDLNNLDSRKNFTYAMPRIDKSKTNAYFMRGSRLAA